MQRRIVLGAAILVSACAAALVYPAAGVAAMVPSNIPSAYQLSLSHYGNLAMLPSEVPAGYRFVSAETRSAAFLFRLRFARNGAAIFWQVKRTKGCPQKIYQQVSTDGTAYWACLNQVRIDVWDQWSRGGEDTSAMFVSMYRARR